MDISELILLISINGLSFFWHPKENELEEIKIVIYIIAGIISITTGVLWIESYFIYAMMVTGLGTFQLILAVIETMRIGGPAKGISQFKMIWNQMKESIHK